MTFTADIVWGCAVAVDRINGGYFKEPVWESVDDTQVIKTHPNKLLMRRWLGENMFVRVTEADIEQGKFLRHYFNSYLMKELSGKINNFERTVLRIAQRNEFTSRDMLEFAIISCLPNSYRRECKNKEIQMEMADSTPIVGEVGDTVIGELIVTRSSYNDNYEKFKIHGRFGESFVDFWYKAHLEENDTVKIKGRIKRHRPDNSTQLNYVKKVS